jgi:hypothetical protein
MKVRQNLEAVFVIAAASGTFASYATAKVPAPQATPAVLAAPVVDAAPVQLVYITAKRLTAAEKAALN